MKTLKIFQENCVPIELQDNDDRDIGTYTKELTNMIELDNMSILHLSSGSLILRPGKILSVLVSENEDKKEIKISNKKEKNIKPKKVEEVITDME